MQTFMPYSDFEDVAKCLDNKRLGCQRKEAWQIYLTLERIKEQEKLQQGKKDFNGCLSIKGLGWANHPIVKMWKGYEIGLLIYGCVITREWRERGFKDTLYLKFANALGAPLNEKIVFPSWIDDKELQLSHQSNLVRKFPEHYRKFFPNVPDNIPYKWVI